VKYNEKSVGADLSTIIFNLPDTTKNDSWLQEKTSVIMRDEALDIGRRFAELLQEQIDENAEIYVFGSTVRNTANIDSDIDIAVISDVYDGDLFQEAGRICVLAQNICSKIEIHPYSRFDWKKGDPRSLEIRQWGVKV